MNGMEGVHRCLSTKSSSVRQRGWGSKSEAPYTEQRDQEPPEDHAREQQKEGGEVCKRRDRRKSGDTIEFCKLKRVN